MPTHLGGIAVPKDRRQSPRPCGIDNVAPMRPQQRLGEHDEPFNASVERPERYIDVLGTAHVVGFESDPQWLGRLTHRIEVDAAARVRRVPEHADPSDCRIGLDQKLDHLRVRFRGDFQGKPGEVTAGMGQAGDEARPDGIDDRECDDRDLRGCAFGGQSGRMPGGDDQIDPPIR
jgi:hypothetical protein